MGYPILKPEAALPPTGWLRLQQIIGNQKANPPIPPIIPIGKSAWYQGIKEKKYPPPIKIGSRTSVWTVESIRSVLDGTYCGKEG